jgi:hypothetical protein
MVERSAYGFCGGGTREKDTLWRRRRKLKDNIKMDLKKNRVEELGLGWFGSG